MEDQEISTQEPPQDQTQVQPEPPQDAVSIPTQLQEQEPIFTREEIKALVRNTYKESLGEMQAALKAEEAATRSLETMDRVEECLSRMEGKTDQLIELLTTPEVLKAELNSRNQEQTDQENREQSNGTTKRKTPMWL